MSNKKASNAWSGNGLRKGSSGARGKATGGWWDWPGEREKEDEKEREREHWGSYCTQDNLGSCPGGPGLAAARAVSAKARSSRRCAYLRLAQLIAGSSWAGPQTGFFNLKWNFQLPLAVNQTRTSCQCLT
jgi:hypothetical protein